MLGFAAQALLEQLAVLAEVVKQPGQSRLFLRISAKRRSILCGPFGNGLQMVANGVSSIAVFALTMRQ